MKKNIRKRKNNNDNKKNVLLIIAVILVGALIAGGTYAYWAWNSNNLVLIGNAYVDTGDMGLTFDAAGVTATIKNLAPAPCTNSTYATKATITLKRYNTSSYPGYVPMTLKLTSFTWKNAKPTTGSSGNLKNIKYLVSTSSSACTTAVKGNDNVAISGDLSGITVGSTANTAQTQTTTLKTWNYTVLPNAGTHLTTGAITETYYLYVWLDSSYEFTNWGSNAVQDPLEGLTFTLQWTMGTLQEGA